METSSFNNNIPSCTWQRSIGQDWDNPYTVRYSSNLDDGPWHGMPLGGFGAGCIGRSSAGDFNLWHLDGGEHIFKTISSCQFSIFEKSKDGETKTYALSTKKPEDRTLYKWDWYPENKGTYHALYPRSWYKYEGIFDAEITCEQFSPIVPNNYRETSYPIGIFEWSVVNPTNHSITLSIMLTWQNMIGWFTNSIKIPKIKVRDDGSPEYEYLPKCGSSEGNFNDWKQDSYQSGFILDRLRSNNSINEGEGQICFTTANNSDLEFFYLGKWNPCGDGSEVWNHFSMNGKLPNTLDATAANSDEQIAAAMAVRFTLKPGEVKKIPFTIAWDLPITEFSLGNKYYRRYTDFFGYDGKNAWMIAETGLKSLDIWREQIIQSQLPILKDKDLPNWFKMSLFNELYLLTDGGTIWTTSSQDYPVGKFGVLECIDYRWYESLDVRLYGSFGLLMLWPCLEKAVIKAFAKSIFQSDDTLRLIGYNKSLAVRKVKGAVAHDLGAPNEHPWEKTNYTSYQDCNLWKDLGSDFVLQVYRDFLLTNSQDIKFLWECWPAVVETLDYLKKFDLDNDGIPENSGAPDQTFDDWELHGVSSYCGALWITALEAAIKIGKILLENIRNNPHLESQNSLVSIHKCLTKYEDWLRKSRLVYHHTLWNGEYYQLDSKSGSDTVMTDQLCGQFYARLLKLPDVVDASYITLALSKIYEACFLNFHDGKYGAANGVKPDGTPENPKSTHPQEVWIGINFGLSAFLIQMGMKNQALKLAKVIVEQIYSNGLQFRTPEAITPAGTFRASHYLRAMAIWSVYYQLQETTSLNKVSSLTD
ncbi:GH116 family glycosyl hydrolase [Candidatus Atelocyanobacterium thalassae]|uniref:Bile acid beta-glucosidase n=1 Tax=cyanobacterium endosymbiont of Braarudosphaera bigelowii TaxID=1285375 RepID=A0ABN6K1L5_9CHRO|nr:GH116 family glycosyl hydrolase [Candidatus Atelocyanobacterium thalassa]BDA39442.1 hypothetical protein CPARK_000028100 [cyanobacterium endosymbiont of Braarudosphaera bigelowii]